MRADRYRGHWGRATEAFTSITLVLKSTLKEVIVELASIDRGSRRRS
jgi:hypothetical protein